MPLSNYPDGFANGLSVRGMPLLQMQPGEIFWVNNSSVLRKNQRAGSNNNRGTFLDPYSTIAGALTHCLANRGDIIFVGPGHAETISTAAILALNVAGVAIIGLGSGALRPTLTFTAAAANIPVTVANCSVQNILHVANFADVASFYTVTGTAVATDFALDGNEFRDTSSILNALTVFTGNATAQSNTGFNFTNNKITSLGTTAATTAIKFASAQGRITLSDNFGVWAVLNDTATLAAFGANNILQLDMARNKVVRPSTSTTGGSLFSGGSTGSTGYVYDNYSWHLDATAGLLAPTGTALGFQNNYSMITGAADKSGLINPAAV